MAEQIRPESVITFNHLEEEHSLERKQEKVSGRVLMVIDVVLLIAIMASMILIF